MSKLIKILAVLLCVWLAGCAKTEPVVPVVAETEEFSYDAKLADSLDEAVVISVNEEKMKIRLHNIETGRTYTLDYTGATTIQDKNGQELVVKQLTEGSLVTITFLKDEKLAKAIYLREDATAHTQVNTFEINKLARTMSFGGEQYDLDPNVCVVSEGEKLELMDINSLDTITVNAVDHRVYSIHISKGHGYVRLVNYDFFVGGWVEVGQSVIKPVTESMLLTVPEGKYTMLISNAGVSGTKEIEVTRNKEVEVDVFDLQGEISKAQEGKIIFTITPSDAILYIDGEETDYSGGVSVPYGLHQMVLKADGYATLKQYFKVNQPLANINVEMEEANTVSGNDSDDDGNTTPSTSTSGGSGTVSSNSSDKKEDSVSSNTVTSSSDYQVYIDAPQGAELYLDGNYVGIIPTSFAKKAGSVSVSVRKTGYQTRSYTLQIDNTKKDVHYSFSELDKTE